MPGGVFHQLQDAGGGGFAVEAFGTDGDAAGEIDGPADHTVAGGLLLRQAFPGEGGGIHRRAALTDDAVQRDLFTGVDDDGLAHRNLLGADPFLPAVPQHVGVIGTNVHKRGYRLSGFARCVALEKLADLIKQQYSASFIETFLRSPRHARINAKRKRAERGNAHKQIFIENLSVKYSSSRFVQNIVTDDHINGKI